MECEVFAVLPKDISSTGYTVEHKDLKVDFKGVFQQGQHDIFSRYIAERSLSQLLMGRNVAHFLVDSSLEQFLSLAREVVVTSLQECSKSRIWGYYLQKEGRCLLSGSPQSLGYEGSSWGPAPFQRGKVEEVKSIQMFDGAVVRAVQENVPGSFELVCLTIALEIIPQTSGTNITKLFPELSILMVPPDHMYINKMISDLAQLSDTGQFSDRIISTSNAANCVGFYLGNNFHCSATFNFKSVVNLKANLEFSKNMKQVKSFPMVNDVYSKGLLTKIVTSNKTSSEPIDSSIIKTLKNDLQVMAKENIKLMEENECLHKQIDKMGLEMNTLLGSKQILSDEVRKKLNNEQEIYNKLTEMAVEKVKIKDMSETKRYELMNKIFSLENELLTAQITAEEWKTKYEDTSNEKYQIETLKNDLQAEYITLKTNHHSASNKQSQLERRCEELSFELVQLHMEYNELTKSRGSELFSKDSASLPEIKRPPSNLSSPHVQSQSGSIVQKTLEEQKQELNTERNRLLQEIMNLKTELNEALEGTCKKNSQKEFIQHSLDLKNTNETHRRKIEKLEDQLYAEVKDKERLTSEFDKLRTTHNTITLLNTKLQDENVALRHTLRSALEEYRIRLDCYIQDTEKYLQRKNPTPHLQSHLKKMVDELRKSYADRERELTEEVGNTRADLLDTLEKYHKLEYEYSQVSNVRMVQAEMARLRKESRTHADAVKNGKIISIEKVEEMMDRQQGKYQSVIEKLRTRATNAESQLNRFMQHF